MNKTGYFLSALSVILGLLLMLSLFRYFQLKNENSELRTRLEGSSIILDSGVLTPVIPVDHANVESAARDAGLNDAVNHGEQTGKKPISFSSGSSKTPGTVVANASSDSVQPSTPKNGPQDSHAEIKPCPKPESAKHRKSFQEQLPGVSMAPLGEVTFETNSDSPWSINIFPREYKCELLDMKGPDGELNRYMKLSVKVKDESYELKIDKSSTLSSANSKEWAWNPRFGSSFFSGIGIESTSLVYGASVGMGLWSYGVDRQSPEYYFVHTGINYDFPSDKFGVVLYPAMINISPVIPWTKSTYLGLGGSLNISGFGIVLGAITLW